MQQLTTISTDPLVPEVYLDFSSFCKAANMSRKVANTSDKASGYFYLNLNLNFMQTPVVKCIKLIITTGTNGNLAIALDRKERETKR